MKKSRSEAPASQTPGKRPKWLIATGLTLFIAAAAALTYAAQTYLSPTSSAAEEACEPSWSEACASVDVAVQDDKLLIHVPNPSVAAEPTGTRRPSARGMMRSASSDGSATGSPRASRARAGTLLIARPARPPRTTRRASPCSRVQTASSASPRIPRAAVT